MEILLIALLVFGAAEAVSPTVRGGTGGAIGGSLRAVGRETGARWAAGAAAREQAWARHRTRRRQTWLGRRQVQLEEAIAGTAKFTWRHVLPVAYIAAKEAGTGAKAGAKAAREKRRRRRAERPLSRAAAIDALIGEAFPPDLAHVSVDRLLDPEYGPLRRDRPPLRPWLISKREMDDLRNAMTPTPTWPVPPASEPPAAPADPGTTQQEGDTMSDQAQQSAPTPAAKGAPASRAAGPRGGSVWGNSGGTGGELTVPEAQTRLKEARAKIEAARADWLAACEAARTLYHDVDDTSWTTKEISATFSALAEEIGDRDAVGELTAKWVERLDPCDRALQSAITTVGEPAAAIGAQGDVQSFQPA